MPKWIDAMASELKLSDRERRVLLATGARTPRQLYGVLVTSPGLAKQGLVNSPLVSDLLMRQGDEGFRSFASGVPTMLERASSFTFGASAPAGAPWQVREPAPNFEETLALRERIEPFEQAAATPRCPWPIRNQWYRGTCVSFAMTALREALDCETRGRIEDLSEQFLYWAIKEIPNEPWPDKDGTTIGYAVEALANAGLCLETEWGYVPNPIHGNPGQGDGTNPTPDDVASASARRHRAGLYQHGTRGGSAKAVRDLLARGRPVAVSLPVFFDPAAAPGVTNWTGPESQRIGYVEDPQDGMLVDGGHAVCLVGYREDPDAPGGGDFIVRNSWGTDWGRELPQPDAAGPEPGYGQVSAWYVDQFLREYCQL